MKKRIIFSAVTIVLILISTVFLVAFAKADKDVQYIKTNYVDKMNGQTLVIETKEEQEEYLNKNKKQYGLGYMEKVYSDSTIGFEDAIAEYDDEGR